MLETLLPVIDIMLYMHNLARKKILPFWELIVLYNNLANLHLKFSFTWGTSAIWIKNWTFRNIVHEELRSWKSHLHIEWYWGILSHLLQALCPSSHIDIVFLIWVSDIVEVIKWASVELPITCTNNVMDYTAIYRGNYWLKEAL